MEWVSDEVWGVSELMRERVNVYMTDWERLNEVMSEWVKWGTEQLSD